MKMSGLKNVLMWTVALSLAGCMTTGAKKGSTGPLSEKAIADFKKNFKDPRSYWLNLHRGPNNDPSIQGGFRLHPRQTADLELKESAVPFRPLVEVKSASSTKHTALLDISSPECWIDCVRHSELGLITLGYDGVIPYVGARDTGGVPAFLTLRTQLRFDHLFMENILFYTRMERGTLGPIGRGMEGEIKGAPVDIVLGWDLLKEFELIRFDLLNRTIHVGVTEVYSLNEERLMGEVNLVKIPGQGCVVMGDVAGEPQLFVLDPAGDFEVVWPSATESTITQIALGDLILPKCLVSSDVVDGKLPRIGGRLLSKYTVTLCPKTKRVYFERPDVH
jgi:hypothetical protein